MSTSQSWFVDARLAGISRQRRYTTDTHNAVSDRVRTLHCPINLQDVRASAVSGLGKPQTAVVSAP